MPSRFVICLISALAGISLSAQQRFPEPHGSTSPPPGEWTLSPIVAVGEVTNIRSFGEQIVDRILNPILFEVHELPLVPR